MATRSIFSVLKDDGSIDLLAYYRYRREQRQRRIAEHNAILEQCNITAPLNSPTPSLATVFKDDGSIDLLAYYRYQSEKRKRRIREYDAILEQYNSATCRETEVEEEEESDNEGRQAKRMRLTKSDPESS